jgi:outer membrane protein
MVRASLMALALLVPAAAHAERLTVEEVVRMATANHPHVAAARAQARAAHADTASAGGRLLPTIVLSEEYQHYARPFDIGFGEGPPLRARNQDTSTFVAGASQPLIGLLQRSHTYSAQDSRALAAEASVRIAQADIREAVETAYLNMFESRAMEDIARASQAELAQQVAVTAAGVQAGTLTNADLLRVKVAEANARQQGIGAHTRFVVARAHVLGAIGRPPTDAALEFAEPSTLLVGRGADVARTATRVDERAEVVQARHLAEAARHLERSRFFALFPDVDLDAAYVRVDGQVFAPANSVYVGLKANWAIWEWGASANARRAASERAEAARSELEAERRRAEVDVATRRAELESAATIVEVAEQSIASAEEAFRVMTALVGAGAATITDLLDAQSALTQARLNFTRARYEQAIAAVQAQRTTSD